LYGLTDALRLRNHILERFERVDADRAQIAEGLSASWSSVAAPRESRWPGAVVELVDMALAQDFRHLNLSSVARIVLVEREDRLLPLFSAPSQRHAREALKARGVEVRLGDPVARIESKAVHLASGEWVPCQTPIWAAGVKANPLANTLGLQQGRAGRIVVGTDLSVPGDPTVFVVGDLAAAEDAHGHPLPQLAAVAIQAGRHAASQIRRRLAGRETTRFRCRSRGLMATIGRGAGIAELRMGQVPRHARMACVARAAPRDAGRFPQPDQRLRELGMELPHLGPGVLSHHRVPWPGAAAHIPGHVAPGERRSASCAQRRRRPRWPGDHEPRPGGAGRTSRGPGG
jgi:Pyridine nucleotide-disulphide oxidoreductase